MKYLGVTLLVVVGALEIAGAAEKYSTKYDNIDLEEILTNKRLYQRYFDCLSGEGTCTPDAKQLKDVIPDALKTKCAKCNEKQRKGAERVLKYVINEKPKDWDKLAKIYDPEGKYKSAYKDEAKKKYGVDVS